MPKKNKLMLDPKRKHFTEGYLNPQSPTYGNAYRSAIAAGFAEQYAKNITTLQPQWLLETIERLIPSETEIIAGIKQETTYGKADNERNTALAAQVRLKAWELLGKTKRSSVFDNGRSDTTVNGDIHITLGSIKPLPGTASGVIEGELATPAPSPRPTDK